MIFEYEGYRHQYESYGPSSNKAILLLHGFMENSTMWQWIIPGLGQYYRIVTLDLIGHGGSDAWSKPIYIDDMAKVAAALLKELQIKEITVCGHSMGGYVALALAEEHPDLVKKLVLFHSTATADSKKKIKSRHDAMEALRSHPKTSIRLAFTGLFHNPESCPDQIEYWVQQAQQTDVAGYIAAQEAMAFRKDRTHLLQHARESIFIAGEKDPLILKAISQQQMDMLGPNDGIWLYRSGHMSHIEETEMSRSVLQAVLKV